MTGSKAKVVADYVFKIAGFLVALTALYAFITRGQAEQEAAQTERSLAVIDRFNGGRVVAARTALTNFWIAQPEFVAAATSDGVTLSAKRQLFRHALMTDEQVFASFQTVVHHFDDLQYCITYALCRADLLQDYFCDFAVDYDRAFDALIVETRAMFNSDSFATGLTAFARDCTEGSG